MNEVWVNKTTSWNLYSCEVIQAIKREMKYIGYYTVIRAKETKLGQGEIYVLEGTVLDRRLGDLRWVAVSCPWSCCAAVCREWSTFIRQISTNVRQFRPNPPPPPQVTTEWALLIPLRKCHALHFASRVISNSTHVEVALHKEGVVSQHCVRHPLGPP